MRLEAARARTCWSKQFWLSVEGSVQSLNSKWPLWCAVITTSASKVWPAVKVPPSETKRASLKLGEPLMMVPQTPPWLAD